MEQIIHITGKIPSANEYIGACRTNAHVGARMKADIERMIMIQLIRMKPIEEPIYLEFTWHERTRRRDKDNVAFGKKFVLDAMQKCGKLPNDNNAYIIGFSDRFDYDNGDYGVTVKIRGE